MLQVKNIHYSIGDRYLLKGVDWVIKPAKRIALVGSNGVGKTTLLKIISGLLQADKGEIFKPKDFQIGYLPQEEISLTEGTVIQEAMKGKEDILILENKIHDLQNQLNTSFQDQSILLEKLGELQQKYEGAEGWKVEEKAKTILSGLGFSPQDYYRSICELSGGWKMRIYLARILLQQPDLLLLDEPTNHLDLPSLEWLEQYLLHFSSSMVMVSHDRFFIDRLAHEINELDGGRLNYYPGNYHYFEKEKEARRILLEEKRLNQLKMLKHQESFINRFRAKNTKATQVQSRIKQLDKIEMIESKPVQHCLSFDLPLEIISYKHVLHMENVSFGYDSNLVIKNLFLDIFRGEKIALVGVNGAGKTTLTRLITGQLFPVEGNVVLGERTHIGYYAQHQIDALNLEATAYDEVAEHVSMERIPKIRDVLGIFQLKGDDVFKKIRVLSGGEKARVSLSKILLSPVNFLIMDEPTNHLDPQSKEALEKALADYEGTLLLISHDRYFLDKITHKVIELKDGGIEEYWGNYSYYLEKRFSIESLEKPGKSCLVTKTTDVKKERKEVRRLEAKMRQSLSQERNRLSREIKQLEVKIEQLEQEKKNIEQQMALSETYQDGQLVVRLQKQQHAITKELQQAYLNWEDTQDQFDKIMIQLRIQ